MFRVSGASKEATPESLFFIRPPRPSPESGLPSTVNLFLKKKQPKTRLNGVLSAGLGAKAATCRANRSLPRKTRVHISLNGREVGQLLTRAPRKAG